MTKLKREEFDRVIFVAGINHVPQRSKRWGEILMKEFPEKELVFIDDVNYIHTQSGKVESLIQRLYWALQEDKKTFVIAHSFGGILTKAAMFKIDPEKRQNLRAFLALATPHSLDYGLVGKVKKHFEVPECLLNVDTYTFGGLFDPIVPCPNTRVENSVLHENINAEHMMFILSKKTVRSVLSKVVEI